MDDFLEIKFEPPGWLWLRGEYSINPLGVRFEGAIQVWMKKNRQ
jgi:hypothetical protein